MLVLVTGGTGVIGQATVTALLERGHSVRLLSRHAGSDSEQWPERVEPHPGDVATPAQVIGVAEGCDAIVHIAGVVAESLPDVTFDNVNVGGTRNVVMEAERAGVKRLVFVSSLGAERGKSGYHRSKFRAEQIVRRYSRKWMICRPGNVYGPGDEVISLILKLVRTLPVIPVIDQGDQPFQPIWYEDLGKALAMAVERGDLAGQTLELAGSEQTSMNDLLRRFATVTGREVQQIRLPGFLAQWGVKAASVMGLSLPIDEGQLQMLNEGNVIREVGGNALDSVFGIVPTSLDVGLRKLADALPEQLPSKGVGDLRRKRYWADISGSALTPEDLFEKMRVNFAELMPVESGTEPGTADRIPDLGETITMSLPVRGTIQVRVQELSDRVMTLATLEGHPIAGAVRFLTEARGPQVRFEVQVYERAANLLDLITMRTVGELMQNATWEEMVRRVVGVSGGSAPENVQTESIALDREQASRIEEWLDDLVKARKREQENAVA
jgi:nucleoside-diphosphate-sugar epimerase